MFTFGPPAKLPLIVSNAPLVGEKLPILAAAV
jgi:hypothetical protein